MRWFLFSIYLILQAVLGPGGCSSSNRNEYQKQKKKKFMRSKVQPVRRVDNLTAYVIDCLNNVDPEHLTTLQAPKPVTEIALIFYNF
jgi:hypothetical protein